MHIYVNVTAKGSPSGTATTTIITYSSSIEKDNIAHESKEMKKRTYWFGLQSQERSQDVLMLWWEGRKHVGLWTCKDCVFIPSAGKTWDAGLWKRLLREGGCLRDQTAGKANKMVGLKPQMTPSQHDSCSYLVLELWVVQLCLSMLFLFIGPIRITW